MIKFPRMENALVCAANMAGYYTEDNIDDSCQDIVSAADNLFRLAWNINISPFTATSYYREPHPFNRYVTGSLMWGFCSVFKDGVDDDVFQMSSIVDVGSEIIVPEIEHKITSPPKLFLHICTGYKYYYLMKLNIINGTYNYKLHGFIGEYNGVATFYPRIPTEDEFACAIIYQLIE